MSYHYDAYKLYFWVIIFLYSVNNLRSIYLSIILLVFYEQNISFFTNQSEILKVTTYNSNFNAFTH